MFANIIQKTGWIGGWEIVVILLVILLLFGGRKLPELMRGMGKGLREFKDATSGRDTEEKTEAREQSHS